MLVLTRKTREQIQIGENVVITILKVKGQTVRVGIEAPRDVRVLRSELPKTEAPGPSNSGCSLSDLGFMGNMTIGMLAGQTA